MVKDIREAVNEINNWYLDECQRIQENAVQQGIWRDVLDGNRELFEPAKAERDQRIKDLFEKMQK